MKVVRGVKKVANKVDTALVNGSLKIQDKLKGTPSVTKVKVAPKTNHQINKETIKTVREAQETGRKILETPINEGLDQGFRFASGNPMTAIVAGVPVPGSTAVAAVGEQALKSKVPIYNKATEKLQEGYSKSKFSRKLRKARLPSLKDLIS